MQRWFIGRRIAILLSMAIWLGASAATAQAPRRVALLIGNSHYQSASQLANPANDKHGRATQLRLWGLEWQGSLAATPRPLLLVLDVSELPRAEQAVNWGEACPILRSKAELPELGIDQGGKRFLLLRLAPGSPATCMPVSE